jgi:hypothetical protein
MPSVFKPCLMQGKTKGPQISKEKLEEGRACLPCSLGLTSLLSISRAQGQVNGGRIEQLMNSGFVWVPF